jgi:hypothetical protein
MSVKRCTVPAVCGLCLILGGGALTAAQQPTAAGVALRWRAPAGCPTQVEVESELTQLVTSESLPAGGAALEVSVTVERSATRWVAQMRMSGRLDAERSLEGDSCAAVAKASAWLAAQALRSLSAADERKTRADLSGYEESSPARAPAAAPQLEQDAPPPMAAEQRAVELAVGVWWDSGALPSSTLALGLEGALWLGSWRFALRPRIFMPRSLTAPELLEGASASFLLVEVPLQACYGWSLSLDALKLGPCASMIVGWMRGASEGLPAARASTGIWLTLEAALAAEWRVSPRVILRGELGLARPMRVPRFVIGRETPLHRTDGWLVRPGIAVGMLF